MIGRGFRQAAVLAVATFAVTKVVRGRRLGTATRELVG